MSNNKKSQIKSNQIKSNHAQNAARGINNGLGVLQVVQNLDAALNGRNARAQRV